jgi:hypothetical protein
MLRDLSFRLLQEHQQLGQRLELVRDALGFGQEGVALLGLHNPVNRGFGRVRLVDGVDLSRSGGAASLLASAGKPHPPTLPPRMVQGLFGRFRCPM